MKAGFVLLLVLVASVQSRADSGISSDGIDATGLELPNGMPLNGAGIGIGQVEGLRPGKSTTNGGPDDGTNSASTVVPTQVYMRTAIANVDGFKVRDILGDDHAEKVASVMISSNTGALGVSPNALLHSSGYATTSTEQRDAALTANHIATRNGNDISAINMSFGMRCSAFSGQSNSLGSGGGGEPSHASEEAFSAYQDSSYLHGGVPPRSGSNAPGRA